MGLFSVCKCGHVEEEHAMDAPEGQQECLAEDCDCEQFEEGETKEDKVPAASKV